MIGLFQVAVDLQQLCGKYGWRFCFIGGLALQRWGEPRVTQDVDLTLLTGYGKEEVFIRELSLHYTGRIEDAAEFALKNRVLLLQTETGIGIDIALGALPFEERVVNRGSYFEFLENIKLYTCSAEYLIVLKAFADRDQDWLDIQGVLIRQRGQLDFDLINAELEPLCELKEAPHILPKLHGLQKEI